MTAEHLRKKKIRTPFALTPQLLWDKTQYINYIMLFALIWMIFMIYIKMSIFINNITCNSFNSSQFQNSWEVQHENKPPGSRPLVKGQLNVPNNHLVTTLLGGPTGNRTCLKNNTNSSGSIMAVKQLLVVFRICKHLLRLHITTNNNLL